jgi:hypothetical protein
LVQNVKCHLTGPAKIDLDIEYLGRPFPESEQYTSVPETPRASS